MVETKTFRHRGFSSSSSKDGIFAVDRKNQYVVALGFLYRLQREGVPLKDISYIGQAISFAFHAHEKTPARKNGDAFITHPLAVMEGMVQIQDVWNPNRDHIVFREGLARAVLHDVIEEVPVGSTPQESWERQEVLCQRIQNIFGKNVVDGTLMLTKKRYTPDGVWRNPTYFSDVFSSDIVNQSIKAVDRKHNLDSSAALDLHNPSEREHALLYAQETRDIVLPFVTRAELHEMITRSTNHLFTKIAEANVPLQPRRHTRSVRVA